jgi:hypothetical protein
MATLVLLLALVLLWRRCGGADVARGAHFAGGARFYKASTLAPIQTDLGGDARSAVGARLPCRH